MSSSTSSWQNYVSRGLVNMYPKLSTCYMGDVKCPVCGFSGVLRMDLRGKTTYYYITHYREVGNGWTNHNSRYTHAHYIGDKFKLGVLA